MFDVHTEISNGSTYISPTTSTTQTLYNVGVVDNTTTTVCDLSSPHPHSTSTLLQAIESIYKIGLTWSSWAFQEWAIPPTVALQHQWYSLLTCIRSTIHYHHFSHSSPVSYDQFHITTSILQTIMFPSITVSVHAQTISGITSQIPQTSQCRCWQLSYSKRSLSCLLVLTSFTHKQCHCIQSKPSQIFLQKCSYSSMMHCYIVYGPRSLGGLGFCDLFTTQGVQHAIKLIQKHQTPGQPCNLLCLLLIEW